jgi:hypothetical protein
MGRLAGAREADPDIASGDRSPLMFVANEVLIDPSDRGLADRLIRMGAMALPPRPLQREPATNLRSP